MRVLQFILFSLFFASQATFAEMQFNLTKGVTPVSHDIFDLHMTIFWICVAIGLVVFGVMLYSIIYHRKSRGAIAANFHEHLYVELLWSFIPFVILIAMAIPATKVLIHMSDTDKPDITIKVTGFQWKWKYDYLDQDISFFSNNATSYAQMHNKQPKTKDYLQVVDHPLVVPIHRKIRFLVTGNDVIHSWWVPDFGVKRDAVPGFINEAWARINRAGTYHGQCAELCGMNHGFMPIVVIALPEKDFDNWVIKQKGGTPPVTAPAATLTTAAPVAASTAKLTTPTAQTPAITSNAAPITTVAAQAPAASSTTATAIPTPAQAPAPSTAPITKAAAIPTPAQAPTPSTAPITKAAATPAAAQTPTPSTAPITKAAATPAAAQTPPTTPTTAPLATTSGTIKTLEEQMKQGEDIFLNTCAACHQPSGEGLPPMYPALKGSPVATGPLPAHLNRVLNGKIGTAMQAFKEQFSDDDLAAVITYERNAFGNDKGDVVQPEQIKAAKALPPTD